MNATPPTKPPDLVDVASRRHHVLQASSTLVYLILLRRYYPA